MKQSGKPPSAKLSLALHALGHMAQQPDRAQTSEEIARHHATHPVVVRRVFGLLRRAGILASEKGHHGGWRLIRPASQVTLADIYRAIGEPFLTASGLPPQPQGTCAIEVAMAGTVAAALAEAEAVIARHFAARTLADIAGVMPLPLPAADSPEISAFPGPDSPL